jgi:hypothetical protein
MRALVLSINVLFLGVSLGQNLCDDAYGAHCPESSGWDVGECLKKLESTELSAECVNFIKFHDECTVSATTIINNCYD